MARYQTLDGKPYSGQVIMRGGIPYSAQGGVIQGNSKQLVQVGGNGNGNPAHDPDGGRAANLATPEFMMREAGQAMVEGRRINPTRRNRNTPPTTRRAQRGAPPRPPGRTNLTRNSAMAAVNPGGNSVQSMTGNPNQRLDERIRAHVSHQEQARSRTGGNQVGISNPTPRSGTSGGGGLRKGRQANLDMATPIRNLPRSGTGPPSPIGVSNPLAGTPYAGMNGNGRNATPRRGATPNRQRRTPNRQRRNVTPRRGGRY